jgi:hypothetical protein
MARPSFCPGKSLELGRVWGELAFFGVFGEPRESPKSAVLQVLLIRGDDRNRTGVDGFAESAAGRFPLIRAVLG